MKLHAFALTSGLALALAACGGSAERGAENASGEQVKSVAEANSIGTIEATINGEIYSFVVPTDRGAEEKEFVGVPTLNITGMTRKPDGALGLPYITLMVQDGAVAMQNVTIHDGSMMHQLDSTGPGSGKVVFSTRESGGPYKGTFSATLERLDADSMPEGEETMFTAPVEVSGKFDIE